MIRIIVLTAFVMLFAVAAYGGEYYQYTDEHGNLRFTDDITQIPESRRENATAFESVSNVVSEGKTDAASDLSESGAGEETAPAEITQHDTDPGHETLTTKAEELNKIQAELKQTRASLENERAELEAQAPEENATTDEKNAYALKVEALNSRIDQYAKDIEAFEEKVHAFNNPGQAPAPQE